MSSDNPISLNEGQQKSGIFGWLKNLIWKIPRKLRIVLSIVMFTVVAVMLLNHFKPEARKQSVPETVVRVDVISAELSSYPIVVTANGTIEAETRGNLVAQVRGEIVAMAENFKTGGSFNKDDELLRIDPRDYQAELSRAAASLSQADAAYRQEQANAKQAREDWERLGNTTPAPDLVLRKPQLAAARASLDSARAAHQTAQLNLSRTRITAPYGGRVIRRDVVLGQYVGVGTPIAEVFSTGGVEVRLPISQDEFTQLGLDQVYPLDSEDKQSVADRFAVLLTSTIGGRELSWQAKITRTDSTFDLSTRQIDVIAEVIDPFGKQNQQTPLKIGQFVNAQIQGRTVDDIFVIPNKSVREGKYTYVVRDGRLAKQDIHIAWQDDSNTLVDRGLSAGDLVVTTSLNSTLAGAKAKLPENLTREPAVEPSASTSTESADKESKARAKADASGNATVD